MLERQQSETFRFIYEITMQPKYSLDFLLIGKFYGIFFTKTRVGHI